MKKYMYSVLYKKQLEDAVRNGAMPCCSNEEFAINFLSEAEKNTKLFKPHILSSCTLKFFI